MIISVHEFAPPGSSPMHWGVNYLKSDQEVFHQPQNRLYS